MCSMRATNGCEPNGRHFARQEKSVESGGFCVVHGKDIHMPGQIREHHEVSGDERAKLAKGGCRSVASEQAGMDLFGRDMQDGRARAQTATG